MQRLNAFMGLIGASILLYMFFVVLWFKTAIMLLIGA